MTLRVALVGCGKTAGHRRNHGHNRFDNQSIKKLGRKQIVPTEQGMRETFAYLRAGLDGYKQ
jgi:hypothetical protein